MKKVIGFFKNRFTNREKGAIVLPALVLGLILASQSPTFAALTVDTDSVTTTFSEITTIILTVVGAVAASAVTIMGILLAWKYGRKLFAMLAK